MADIAINPVDRRVQFTGNTGTGPFAFTFNILADEDIVVYKNTTLLSLTTDYTVSTNADGTGSVTLVAALIASDVLTIIGGRELERTTDFVTAGDLLAVSLNEQLDSLVIMSQQLDEKMTRSFKVNPGDQFTDLEMPLLDDRKGKYLAFNTTTGDPEAGPDQTDVVALASITSDIATLADIEDGTDATDAIQTVAGISANVTTVAGISANVTTVAGISSDVTTVAGDEADIGTVSTNISNVNTVAGISANVTTVAGISSDVTTVAGISSDVTSVAGDATDIGTVATNIADVNTAASNITEIQNASANAATATTKAAEAAASATTATTQATNAANSATAAAASQTAAANSAAAAASAFDNFDDTYLGSKTSDPTVDNDGDPLNEGDLYFNSSANEMRVYDGANWIAASSSGSASLLNYNYTATSGQTTFSGADDNAASLSYTTQNLIVTLNGIVLEDGTDYTASNGTSIVLTTGAAAGDELNVVAFKSFTTADMVPASTGGTFSGNVTVSADLTVGSNALFVDESAGNVGIGTSSMGYPDFADNLTIADSANAGITIRSGGTNEGSIYFSHATGSSLSTYAGYISYDHDDDDLRFATDSSVRATIDASGNLLVGKTSSSYATDGFEARASGQVYITDTTATPLTVRRNSTNGDMVSFLKDGTTVGSISFETAGFSIDGESGHTGIQFGAIAWVPRDNGVNVDNAVDLGFTSGRFDDIYATNGTIQTSDRNEKQDIEALSDAEQRVAVACKGLLRKFRWIDAVAEKGDDARIHFGIIAQDLQDAFAAEGLDAGRYAMFISSTWWETQTEVPAVEAVAEVLDEDGNVVTEAVEAKEAYTRTDTYETAEEAPAGATERTRLGVRYPELLAFIIGAM